MPLVAPECRAEREHGVMHAECMFALNIGTAVLLRVAIIGVSNESGIRYITLLLRVNQNGLLISDRV